MTDRIAGVYTLHTVPVEDGRVEAPVLLDSPHSGNNYPSDFGTIVPLPILHRVEDAYVDQLYGDAPDQGATLLCAEFPRSYIDPNRGEDDLDWRLLDGRWPEPLAITEKTRLGHGLIWRSCPGDLPMYDRLLSIAEVKNRIETYWRPYHDTLESELMRLYSLYGGVWHINCHSMPAASSPFVSGATGGRRADMVLGDLDGRSCDKEFTLFVRDCLIRMGYNVRINTPYKGAELVRRGGAPDRGRHSIQIEINRALYMDEHSLEPTRNFRKLKENLRELVAAVCDYALANTSRMAAE